MPESRLLQFCWERGLQGARGLDKRWCWSSVFAMQSVWPSLFCYFCLGSEYSEEERHRASLTRILAEDEVRGRAEELLEAAWPEGVNWKAPVSVAHGSRSSAVAVRWHRGTGLCKPCSWAERNPHRVRAVTELALGPMSAAVNPQHLPGSHWDFQLSRIVCQVETAVVSWDSRGTLTFCYSQSNLRRFFQIVFSSTLPWKLWMNAKSGWFSEEEMKNVICLQHILE